MGTQLDSSGLHKGHTLTSLQSKLSILIPNNPRAYFVICALAPSRRFYYSVPKCLRSRKPALKPNRNVQLTIVEIERLAAMFEEFGAGSFDKVKN